MHAFDEPTHWEGHATVITESVKMLPVKPRAVVCVVGGGGLFNGVVQGLEKGAEPSLLLSVFVGFHFVIS